MFEQFDQPAVTMTPEQLKAHFNAPVAPVERIPEERRAKDMAKRRIRLALNQKLQQLHEDRASAVDGA